MDTSSVPVKILGVILILALLLVAGFLLIMGIMSNRRQNGKADVEFHKTEEEVAQEAERDENQMGEKEAEKQEHDAEAAKY
jgi:flagellar biosynthesis/type III secretory pathway M-ring protein FliF/YscJ